MEFGDEFTPVAVRQRPSYLRKIYLWIKFYGYWHFAGSISTYYTVITMFLKREQRLYYLYSTGELVTVTAFNYADRVKVDGAEFALIKTTTPTGVSYTKGERF
jgi:hypothetical protein